jgi:hypothetical protein
MRVGDTRRQPKTVADNALLIGSLFTMQGLFRQLLIRGVDVRATIRL